MLNSVYITFYWHWIIADINQVYDLVDLQEPSLLQIVPDTYNLFHGQVPHIFPDSVRIVFKRFIISVADKTTLI